MRRPFYIAKTLTGVRFEEALQRVQAGLKAGGFGILTNLRATVQDKLGVDVHDYRILGVCNLALADKALKSEDKIGTVPPCDVIVQQIESAIEVAVIDPAAAMERIDNPALAAIADEVKGKLVRVIENL